MSDSSGVNPAVAMEIGREYPPPGEDKAIEKLGALHLQIQQKQPGPDKRGEHPKTHAGIWATFKVESDIPRELRTGIFAEQRSYSALVRYSNGRTADDHLADVHGMAVKVLIPNQAEPSGPPLQQDFILADHPVFFAKNVQHIFEFLAATASGVPASQLAMSTHPKLIGFTNQAKASLLMMTYWSQTPYKLGDGAVKYLLIPSTKQESPTVQLADSPDFLREALVEQLTLQKVGAQFDFCVNPQADAEAMPIEDPTVEWTSPPIKLATISIYPQKFNSPEQMSFVENLAWSPWNCLPQHSPLGGINRARKSLYRDSRDLRFKTNGVQSAPVTGREVF